MHLKILIISIVTGLLAFPGYTTASSGARFLNDGNPVQVHVNSPAHDKNHIENEQMRSQLHLSTNRVEDSKVEASTAGFQIPIRRGLSNNIPDILTIAAYVDHDDVSPDSLLDWNCGDRTYDTETFNHNGTDFNGAQFPWLTMATDGVIVVAAADGVIIEKHDGEFDQNCVFDPSADANRVILQHDDGKITIYAHIKKGSVTPRKVGDRVEQGDYLGVMGSSGQSTGPHLHFGVQDQSNQLFDPYAGNCNALNNESLWQNQESYAVKKILTMATHSAQPESPPCPQQEVPHFNNIFEGPDSVFASVTVRDLENLDEIFLEVIGPNGLQVLSTTFVNENPGHISSASITFGFVPGQSALEGKYIWRASYAGQTQEHFFYIGPGPAAGPIAVAANNAYAGLWYDSLLDGEGLNIVPSIAGTIVYYYGSDDQGNRLWLVSDLIEGAIKNGQTLEVLMFESSGGVFSTPVPSARGLSIWGTLHLTFNTCESGQSILSGLDGVKVSTIVKLAGVSGAACVEGAVPVDAPWSGLWYDATKDGEGYNLIGSPGGRILYFYGFKVNGLRVWFVSELITQTLSVGTTVTATLYESTQGTFSNPIPSSNALVIWGTAKITVLSCTTMTIVIQGTDGSKTSSTVRLAGIIGTDCTN